MKPWILVTLAAWCLLACGNEDDAGPAGSGGATGGSACWPVAGGAAAHMPIEIKAEVVLVAQGKSLQKPASWTGCAEPWCN